MCLNGAFNEMNRAGDVCVCVFRFIYLWIHIIHGWNGTEFTIMLFQCFVFTVVNTEKCFSHKQETGMEILPLLSDSGSHMLELLCNLPHSTLQFIIRNYLQSPVTQ